MGLDHSRLGVEKNSWKTNQSEFLCVCQVYFTNSCQQIWGCVNQPFILFIHHIWGETVLWGAVFIIQTSDRMQYFTIFQDKLHSVNIQDDQSWAFSETVQKISKITYTASRFSAFDKRSSVWMNINRVTLQHNNEFIMLISFLFNGFITMCNLEKRLIRATFWVLLQAMFMKDWKQTAQRLKLQKRLLTINKRNIIRWNI